MSVTYNIEVNNVSNIAAKMLTLEGKINIDLDITVALIPPITYSAPSISITFASLLNHSQRENLQKLVKIIIEEATTQEIQPIQLDSIQRQSLTAINNPTNQHDKISNYTYGSMVLNSSTNQIWFCQDNTTDNAIWTNVNPPNGTYISQNYTVNGSGTISGNTSVITYLKTSGNTLVENQAQILMSRSGQLVNLYAWLENAPGTSATRRFTIRINGVDSSLLVNIVDNNTNGQNTTDSVSVSAGDLVSVCLYNLNVSSQDGNAIATYEFVSS